MAKQLNINKCWFHKNHYDIPKRRKKEIESKCTIVSSKDIVNIINNKYNNIMDNNKVDIKATIIANHKDEIKANKELRVALDVQLQRLKALPSSRERILSITKIQEAIMWLGMDLKRLNDTNPYPDSYNPSNTKIAPTADNLKM